MHMPIMMHRFLTMRQVCELTTLSRRTIGRLVSQDKFPPPIRLTSGRRAWRAEDVEAWMEGRRSMLDDLRWARRGKIDA